MRGERESGYRSTSEREESRLRAALHHADDLLLASLRREDKERRRRRGWTWALMALGAVTMIAIGWILVAVFNGTGHGRMSAPDVAAVTEATSAAKPTLVAASVPSGATGGAASAPGTEGDLLAQADGATATPPTLTPRQPARNPRAGRPGAAGAAANSGNTTSLAPKQTDVDLAGAKEIDVNAAGDWKYVPEAVMGRATNQSIVLTGGTGDFFERLDGLFFAAPASAKAAIVHLDAPPGKPAVANLERLDLAQGGKIAVTTLPEGMKVVALSPDASRVALQTAELGMGNHDRVDIYDVRTPAAKLVVSFTPLPNEDWSKKDVDWVAFVDNDHVLTLTRTQQVVLWKIPEAKAIYIAQLGMFGAPQLTPNRKYVLLPGEQGAGLFNALTGEAAGRLAEGDGEPRRGRMGGWIFHLNGKLAAQFDMGRVTVWDLTKPAQVADIYVPSGANAREADFVGDGFILLDGRYLLDYNKGLVVWEYTPPAGNERMARGMPGATANGGVYNGRYWFVEQAAPARGVGRAGSRIQQLVSVLLPTDDAKKMAASLNADNEMAIKPGVKVTLEVNISERAAEATAALKKQMEANGMIVADGQPIKLIADTTPGDTKQLHYRMFGQGADMQGAFAEEHLNVTFAVDGKPAWTTSSLVAAPSIISLKKDETLDQSFAETKKNAYRFFEGLQLPKRLPKPRDPLGYGRSVLAPPKSAF